MDNQKTGALIREARKGRNLTQRELGERLHVTDRAVSKWERGLCAPDLSLLEPLAEALGLSVTELIAGERRLKEESAEEQEERTRQVLRYSQRALGQKLQGLRRRYLGSLLAGLAAVIIAGGLWLWNSGVLFVEERVTSPDGATTVTVYGREMAGRGFSRRGGTSLTEKRADGAKTYVTYGDCAYQGLWWSPDSEKYVLAMEDREGSRLVLVWQKHGSVSNLNAYLSMGVEASELSRYGYSVEGVFPDISYQFLQWGVDGDSMLIYYAFSDQEAQLHEGYFWYNCREVRIDGVLELKPEMEHMGDY